MKKMLLWILPVLLLCGAPMHSMAAEAAGTEVTIQLEALPEHLVTQVMKAKKKADEVAASEAVNTASSVVAAVKATDPAELKAWLDVVGESLAGFCKTLGIGANEFIKTPVGMMIAGIAVFNYGGLAVINIISGLVLSSAVWIIFTCIWLWSFRRSHFKRMWKPFWPWDKTTAKELEPAFTNEETRGISMALHLVAWLVVSLCCCLGAFANW